MNRTRMLALLAGAAMSAGVASAQTAQNAALEREILADSAARASFQAGGTAGHDGGFFLGDAAGNYRLEIGGYTQFRYTINNRDTSSPDEDMTNGFGLPVAALEFGGNVVNPNLGYYIRTYMNFDAVGSGSDDTDGDFELADAYGTYSFDNGLTLVWGQFLAPVIRERIVDERYQLAASRSVTAAVFSPDYTQGVALAYANENFKVIGSFNDGAMTANTPYYSPAEADWAGTGRVEFKWAGDWEQFDDFTSFRGTEGYAGLIGGAVHYQSSGDTGNTTSFGGTDPLEADLLLYSADVSVEGNGWNVFGAFIGRNFDPSGADSSDDFGAVIHGGLFLTDAFEIFGRWDAVFPDDDAADVDDFHTVTFGGNYYFFPGSHAAKFTADLAWTLDDQGEVEDVVGFTVPNQYTGFLPASDDEQWMVRLQMQLVF